MNRWGPGGEDPAERPAKLMLEVADTAHREEVLNVTLAHLLKERGAHARAETIVKTGKSHSLPDVIVDWLGVRIAIECKFEGSGIEDELRAQVERRLDDALGDVGVALIYPIALKTASSPHEALMGAALKARFFSPGRSGTWVPLDGVAGLTDALDQARSILIDDDAVSASAERMNETISVFERAVSRQPGRLDDLFCVVAASDATTAGGSTPKGKKAAAAIAGLSLCTAAMLQVELSKVDGSVPKLPALAGDAPRARLLKSWRLVLEHDYAAIFGVATDVLDVLEDDQALDTALRLVEQTARAIATQRILGRHDLVGRVYHALLSDQKYLATYFTSVPAATLLCHLVVDRALWADADWAVDPAAGVPLTIGDLACGTGTLLVGAIGAMRQQWATARAEAHLPIEQQDFGQRVIEDGAWGFDVLSYALQICASTMLLGSPGTVVSRTRLHKMPFGGKEGRLGSLDLLDEHATGQLWGEDLGANVAIDIGTDPVAVDLPHLDVVIMNPPFTRSVGGSRLLGSLEAKELVTARERLRQLIKRPDVSANLTAGLGAPFVELAQRAVKSGGRLALVLPKSVLTGEAWEPTRRLLASEFHLEVVITAHETDHWNFSDSTELSEALLIARRWGDTDDRESVRTSWVALRNNPDTVVEALGVARAIRQTLPPSDDGDLVRVTDDLEGEVGEAFSRPAPVDGRPWRHGNFSRAVLDRVGEALLDGEPVPIPGGPPFELPIRPLSELATIGYDRRDITDAFELVSSGHGYPALWGQEPETMDRIVADLNQELRPRTAPAKGRKAIKPADQVWSGAGRLMILERLRTTTFKVLGLVVPERAVSNTWWSVNVEDDSVEAQQAVALWLNSTLGIASFIAAAEETQGPWMGVKKNKLKTLPVLDTTALSGGVLEALGEAWTNTLERSFMPVAKLDSDPARAAIDRALCSALGLDGERIERLRRMLSNEPRVNPAPRKKRTPALAPEVTIPLF